MNSYDIKKFSDDLCALIKNFEAPNIVKRYVVGDIYNNLVDITNMEIQLQAEERAEKSNE